MTIPITVAKRAQTRFKLRALRAFPREFIGFLVGRRAQEHLEVLDMYFPAVQKEYATEGEVTISGHWWMLSMDYAAQQKMIVLESAHTLHLPGRARRSGSNSEHWRHGVLGGADLICGIANVVEGSDGKKKCGDIA